MESKVLIDENKMKNRWSLCVKNFRNIENAEIEVSPFMIFIGDNNSGKSYLMSLMWGIVNKGYELFFTKEVYQCESYIVLKRWYDENLDDDSLVINNEARKLLIDWFNHILELRKDSLIKSIFYKEISIDKVSIKLIDSGDVEINLNTIKNEVTGKFFILNKDKLNDYQEDIGKLCYFVLFSEYKRTAFNQEEPLFLPASRTGFMLTYKTLINESLKSSYGNDNIQRSKFTAPIINFLNKFVDLNVEVNGKYFDIVKFIEKELLKGKIVEDDSPVKNIYYKPENLNENLPLYLTSSLVTEVAPLVLFLSDVNSDFKTLIIEEPEAHLHLKAQIVMARVVTRLINLGLNVWITTHSDTFMQKINNLMKLNVHENKEKLLKQLNLEREDCLDITKVRVYEFDINENITTVTAIKNSETGFPLPTFNNVISKLMDEVMILEDEE